MKIVIPGGTGNVGAVLERGLLAAGHRVIVLTRNPSRPHHLHWDGRTLGPWAEAIDGADAVVNLAGRSVSCRYTPENLKAMMDSRIDSTRVVGEAVAAATAPPPVWLQASTATIYAHTFGRANDEATGVIGGAEPDAPAYWAESIAIAQAWERTLDEADTPHTRKVAMRSAMTMSPDRGSVFDVLSRMVLLGLGGPVGGGRQYVSWIHEEDFVRAVLFLIDRADLSGPVNLASPHPLRQKDFMRVLRRAWGGHFGLPATRWMAELGAFALRSDTELLLKSRRVIPGRLEAAGFAFTYPAWEAAADDLARRVAGNRRWPLVRTPGIHVRAA
ncbi:TIGR01777 family oxidoreductase [Glycomyces sp. A-F 0318]|uniref:TIGR01777 family oxidoreductase n=1 Tax=Glycomyces amatae TaxID=2881355 RepID=UPI001E31C94E|nr:TIGR01777 family oxidoreductase [Glycomyces amatae]MCD0442235.1 TIGR01777 family oxidoreductase [Glycomyces amatae]